MDYLQARKHLAEAIKYFSHDGPQPGELLNWLYVPDPRLSGHLDDLRSFLQIHNPTKSQRQEAGYLLEKILVLSFKGLAGASEIKNYQSASHQYDLVISGDGDEWDTICNRLYLRGNNPNQSCRTILIEAKAIGKPVSSPQFARLCHILNIDFSDTVDLGILFTLNGAAGFPKRGDKRAICVRHARLCQLLFYAKSGKKVLVLDQDDILELDQNGSLMRILIRKIRELEQASGLPTTSSQQIMDVDLPVYLQELL